MHGGRSLHSTSAYLSTSVSSNMHRCDLEVRVLHLDAWYGRPTWRGPRSVAVLASDSFAGTFTGMSLRRTECGLCITLDALACQHYLQRIPR